ncbi:hypothetical protein [uncultured Aquimarina sp.]|uniref:hypothetical protein n=1 Tax=uncultured Aquimarina sp. TaxID=575652 RepID=UPI002628F83B|nr:hypothetical protein [uncultured Aquimarina sp.]
MRNLLLTIAIILIPITNICACSCSDTDQPLGKKVKEAFLSADLIFTGKVIDIKEINTILPYKSSSDPVVYTFEVIQKIKGKTKKTILKILSSNSGASCGYNFQLGESYLVYSSVSDHFAKQTGIKTSFVTSLCRRNQELQSVHKKELKKLFIYAKKK